jgi:hypothetical protein
VALYHLTAQTGTRATGASALAKVQYIQREARYARVPDAVVYTTSRNLPSFADGSAAAYWDAADLYERANGRLFKEVEFALPVELPAAEQRQLAESFAAELTTGERLPYTLAIHEGRGHNPHCHVLVSERVNDGIEREASQWFRRWNERDPEHGGARKSRALHPREWLETIRQRWAELVNRALERAGFRERVDHRSLAVQGAEREPQIHLGPNVGRMKERGLGSDRADEAERIAARNRALAERGAAPPSRSLGTREDRARETDANARRDRASELHRTDLARSRSASTLRTTPDRASELEPDPHAAGASRQSRLAERNPLDRADRASAARSSAQAARGDLDRSTAGPTPADITDPDARGTPAPHTDRVRDRSRDPSERERSASISRSSAARSPSREHEPEPASERSTPGPIDRTARAVARQLRALGCAEFEVGIHDRASGQMMNRTWSAEQVLEHLPSLKRMNARGRDIYVRPSERSRHGLVLLDDLTPAALGRLERDGRDPAAVIETSPGNFQAWVRVPSRASALERGVIARRLAREYEADRASASPQQYGRLAGFTNRKEQHRSREGLQPFALLRSASGRPAPDGELLLRQAERALRERERERARGRARGIAAPALGRSPAPRETQREVVELYRSAMEELRERTPDVSRCDFAAAVRLLTRGCEPALIRQAMREASPDLEERKRGHVEDYVRRTVEAAVRFHERSRARGRNRGRDGPER